MMRSLTLALFALCALAPGDAVAQPSAVPSPPQPDIVHVDGTRSPELIPQWSVWGYVFRVVSGGPRQLPSSVIRLVSKDEEALVMKEADAVQKVDAACQTRAAKAAARLGIDTVSSVDAKVREIAVKCRWETLRARDRVLAGINPEAATALAAFAESTKAGTTISLPRKDLARYLEPE